ncbi:MAG: hypothetical protein HZA37_00650 [Parcubacteria group bacterium]|nr:hypothetical protein [Parcubacteria group bacterium]
MILLTHAVIGSVVASASPNPLAAFFFAWIGHYCADAVPHWDYSIKNLMAKAESGKSGLSAYINKNTATDLLKITADFAGGVFLTFSLFSPTGSAEIFLLAGGVIGGVLPDFLLFLEWIFPNPIFRRLEKFHASIHSKIKMAGFPLGWATQIFLIAAGLTIIFFR